MIHMTETRQEVDLTFGVVCRCGWTARNHRTRMDARRAGDEHLAVWNGVER